MIGSCAAIAEPLHSLQPGRLQVGKFSDALRIALRMEDHELAAETFAKCEAPGAWEVPNMGSWWALELWPRRREGIRRRLSQRGRSLHAPCLTLLACPP